MSSTWERIPQTHRTILFEKFTHPADSTAGNLYDILSLHKDSAMSDAMYRDIHEKLEVRSFSEFLKKFQPKVFEIATGTEEGVPTFQYTMDPMEAQKNNGRPIEITSHTYYEMLSNMYSQKSDSGVANIDFNDAKLREILTPKREIDALYDTRRQIPLLMEKYDAAVKKNENAAPIVKKLKNIRRNALEQLKNPTAMMAIRLDDITRKIEAADKKILQLNAAPSNGGEPQRLLSGRGGFDNKGRWVLIPATSSSADSTEASDNVDGGSTEKFAHIMEGDLDKHAAQESSFTKAMVVSTYTGVELADPMENMDSTALVEYRDKLSGYKEIIEQSFKQAKEAFIQVLSEIVQKILCVKIFFDHATVKGGNDSALPKVGLIVANCTADKLLDDKVRDKFIATMHHLGVELSDDNKLWFAILPHVVDEDFSGSNAAGTESLDDDLDFDDAEEKAPAPSNGTDFAAARSLIKIMEDCKILTVFNFAPNPATTFSNLSVETINALQNKVEEFNCEHAVYALPNFTIMREGTVPLDDSNEKISVPAIYIDASYVAAGLLVAAQQPEFWISRGFKEKESFTSENACVRIDFESDKIISKLLTKFNRERLIAWSADVVNALTKSRFGFAFDGDKRYDENLGAYLQHTYILNARTLKRKDGVYQPIFRTLTKDFIRAYLRSYGSKLKDSQLKDFLNKTVAEWSQQTRKYRNVEIINLLLGEGENIVRDGSTLKVEFSSGEDFLDVDIVD